MMEKEFIEYRVEFYDTRMKEWYIELIETDENEARKLFLSWKRKSPEYKSRLVCKRVIFDILEVYTPDDLCPHGVSVKIGDCRICNAPRKTHAP